MSRFVCGYLNCDQRFAPLVEGLPTMLVVRSRDDYSAIEAVDASGIRPTVVPQGSGTWLGTTLKFTISEARTARPGNAAMLGRLTELMFVEILREYMHRLPEEHGGWLAGAERSVRRQSLAPAARESRPRLDRRRSRARGRGVAVGAGAAVHGMVGESPMRYLAGWRMQIAKQMMREGARKIQDVAAWVGTTRSGVQPCLQAGDGSPPVAWRRARRQR